MKKALAKLRDDLGALGIASLLVIGATALASIALIQPLEQRKSQLDRQRDSAPRRPADFQLVRLTPSTPAAKLDGFYRYFDRPEKPEDWLAKIYGIASASGLVLRSAEYRLTESRQRIERYQLTLPVTGNYTQIRGFVEGAMAEIPVLSLDQVSFRRKSAQEGRVEAEIILTLHLVKK